METPTFDLARLQISPGLLVKGSLFLFSIALGQWFLSDVVHFPGGEIGFISLITILWLFSSPLKAKFNSPLSVQGWIKRCHVVIDQFSAFEDESKSLLTKQDRLNTLKRIVDRTQPQKIAIINPSNVDFPDMTLLEENPLGSVSITLTSIDQLSIKANSAVLPESVYEQDLTIYLLPLPLKASDLLTLKEMPVDQPSWILASCNNNNEWTEELKSLQDQLPNRWSNYILQLNSSDFDLFTLLTPIRRALLQSRRNIDITRQRLLSRTHSSWQIELEHLRRDKFKSIQQRTQWVVAGAVLASPVPSTDLLALSVANGLMIKEMAEIWDCSCRSDALKPIARQLAKAAIAQGALEWSGHALVGVAKLHGGTWLAAGALQALSAAYLTRVVASSMADWMAMNNGVSEPDLEAIKRDAPKLVANAVEKEKMDWSLFLAQATSWINMKSSNLKTISS